MALSKNTVTASNLEIQDAYIKVAKVEVTKNLMGITISYSKDSDSEAFQKAIYSASYDLDGNNPIAQAYEHLKTLPEFADAVDC